MMMRRMYADRRRRRRQLVVDGRRVRKGVGVCCTMRSRAGVVWKEWLGSIKKSKLVEVFEGRMKTCFCARRRRMTVISTWNKLCTDAATRPCAFATSRSVPDDPELNLAFANVMQSDQHHPGNTANCKTATSAHLLRSIRCSGVHFKIKVLQP